MREGVYSVFVVLALALLVPAGDAIAAACEAAAASTRVVPIQTIRYAANGAPGALEHAKIDGGARRGVTRVCLRNKTRRAKALAHQVEGAGDITAGPGQESCADFPSSIRLHFAFVDNGRAVKQDGMNLAAFAGDIVILDWVAD